MGRDLVNKTGFEAPAREVGKGGSNNYCEDFIDVQSMWSVQPDLKNKFL